MGTMETIGLNLEDQADAPEYYLWEVPGKPVAIHLHYGVIDRLLPEVMRGFGLVPKRGAEVGGILLGRVEHGDKLIVRVEDFEPVPSEHGRGPSYLLTENDLQRLEGALDRWRGGDKHAVGYYRSQTRDGLALSEEDLAILRDYFPSPADIALLIKPFATKVSVAGFFFRENGVYHPDASYLEFPFRRRELGGGSPPAPRTPREEPAGGENESNFESEMREAILRDAAAPSPAPEQKTPAPGKPKWVWIPLSFIFLLLGTLLGFQASTVLRSRGVLPQSTQGYALSLSATRNGSSLHIQWDRQSPAVRAAKRALLIITEGQYKKQLELDAAQLQNGSVVYLNLAGPVSLHLEVYPGDRNTVTERLDVGR